MQASTATALSHNQQIKIIRQAFDELSSIDLQDGFREVHQVLFNKNHEAEKQHRKGAPYGTNHGVTVNDAAKLFTVEHLLEGWQEPDKWTVDAILSIRNEVLYAQAYSKRFHKELEGWAAKWTAPFRSIDYAKLMRAGR